MKKFFNKIFNWYFSRKALPYWSILIIDCLCVLVAGIIAFSLNHGLRATVDANWTLFLLIIGITVVFLIGFRVFRTYSGVFRYSSFWDLLRVSMAVFLALVILVAVELITGIGRHLVAIEIADIVLTAIMTVAMMWIIRIWVKLLHDETIKQNKTIPIFIYGVKEGGLAIAKSISSLEDSPYKIVGFVSNHDDLSHKLLMGHQVYLASDDLASLMKKKGASILFVSPLMMPSLRENQKMVDKLIESGIRIYFMPTAKKWDTQNPIDVSEMREVEPVDLLPRDQIEINMQAAAQMLTGNVVLVTGAAGSIGSEIVNQVASFGPGRLVLVDQAETPMHDLRLLLKNKFPLIPANTIVADIADNDIMERVFKKYKPNYVFHAAAYKHVPMMEDNPYEAVENNILGTKIIADLAVKYGAKKFVMVSTDKAVNPTNVMGCSKRICEIYVQSLDQAIKSGKVDGKTRFVTTRFGNVLGSNGSVIPIFQEQIRKGGPVTVTHPDIIRFFMLIPEACKLVIEAGTMGKGGEIFVFDMGQPVKIADLAERMIKLSGATHVKIEFTGLREGEKLYEEVLNDEEITLPTFHPKIKIAKVREYSFAEADNKISNLIKESKGWTDMEIVAEMKAIVPEFKSKNSIYEVLDK